MAEKLSFELVSPEKILAAGDYDMVIVPAAEGAMGVMPGHAPLITTLHPGGVEVYEGGSRTAHTFIAGGVAEIDDSCSQLTVLAEEALPVDELDQQALQNEIKDLDEDIQDAADDSQRAAAEWRQRVAKAKLQALTGELVL